MAITVSDLLTDVTLAETGDDTNWDDIGGGPGSGQVDGSLIQGSESRGRRIDNQIRGFSFDSTTGLDISASGTHVGFWLQVTQPNLINTDGIELLLGTAATPKSGNWEGHFYDETIYPVVGGWIMIWLDPSRAADSNNGSLTSFTAIRQYGCEFDMGDVGGTSESCLLDAIRYGTSGLRVVTTSTDVADFADFVSHDEGTSANRFGVVQSRDGVVYCNSRLEIGLTATAFVDFQDSNFVVVFTEQPLAAADWMGISIELDDDASANTSDVTLTDGTIKSGGTTVLGDFIVTDTSADGNGSLTCTRVVFDALRTVELIALCDMQACIFSGCGVVDAGDGATLNDCTFTNSTAASSLLWDTNVDPSGELDGCSFVSDGSNHAIELGTNSPLSVTLVNHSYSGYAGSDGSTGNEVIWVRRNSGTVTINVNGGDTPTIRTDGATVNVVNTVTVEAEVQTAVNPTAIQNARVLLFADTGGDLPAGAAVTISRSGTTATVTHTAHGFSTGDEIRMTGTDGVFLGVHTITVTGVNTYTYTVANSGPTTGGGSPAVDAVILNALTNASGIVQDTAFEYTSDQPVTGWVRKSTGSPLYQFTPLAGTIENTGASLQAFMALDE